MRGLLLFTILLSLILMIPGAAAQSVAEDLSDSGHVLDSWGIPSAEQLFDMELEAPQHCQADSRITLEAPEGVASVYLIFDREYGSVLLTDETSRRSARIDTSGILHCLMDVEKVFGTCPGRLTLRFCDGDVWLNELRFFSNGSLPDWVQRWNMIPDGGADLLLLSAHGDDEQLFFAGLLPWYAGEKGYRVQVVYFTDHRNMVSYRVHEMLNGLWAVGVRDYPVFGSFEDYYTFDMYDAYRFYEEQGHSRQELDAFIVEQLRRYQPLVAVSHDEKGEYGHGMHQMCADLLKTAVAHSGDPTEYPQLTEKYGAWDVPKTYLHLYPENQIVMDWDIPLEAFDGKTAYQVTKELGFPSHVSQIKDFAWYFRNADRASDVGAYNPCQFGLYRTTVGADTGAGDFFENVARLSEPLMPADPAPAGTEAPIALAAPQAASADPIGEPSADLSAEENWILIPAAGTIVLLLLTTCLSVPAFKKTQKNVK